MSLAELLFGIENNSLVEREPSEEEIKERFEYFRERNHLVEEILEGKTTFIESLKSSKPLSRRLPFARKSREFKNLEYLLTVPLAYEYFNSMNHNFSNPIIIPKDYYEKQLHYQPHSSDIVHKVFIGSLSVVKYAITPLTVGATFQQGFNPIFYGTTAVATLGLIALNVYGKVTLPGEMVKRANMLDNLVESVYDPSHNNELLDNKKRKENYNSRKSLVKQWIKDAEFYHNEGIYDMAIELSQKAIKSDPLNFDARGRLILAYAQINDPRCFDELREARIIFGFKVYDLDTSISTAYGMNNDVDGYYNKITDSVMTRAGVAAIIKLKKSIESNKMQA